MTRWSPDTCECVVEYDDQINVTAVINKCRLHTQTKSDGEHLAAILAHNRAKNAVFNIVNPKPSPDDGISVSYDASGSGLVIVGIVPDVDQMTRIKQAIGATTVSVASSRVA